MLLYFVVKNENIYKIKHNTARIRVPEITDAKWSQTN